MALGDNLRNQVAQDEEARDQRLVKMKERFETEKQEGQDLLTEWGFYNRCRVLAAALGASLGSPNELWGGYGGSSSFSFPVRLPVGYDREMLGNMFYVAKVTIAFKSGSRGRWVEVVGNKTTTLIKAEFLNDEYLEKVVLEAYQNPQIYKQAMYED